MEENRGSDRRWPKATSPPMGARCWGFPLQRGVPWCGGHWASGQLVLQQARLPEARPVPDPGGAVAQAARARWWPAGRACFRLRTRWWCTAPRWRSTTSGRWLCCRGSAKTPQKGRGEVVWHDGHPVKGGADQNRVVAGSSKKVQSSSTWRHGSPGKGMPGADGATEV